MRFPNDTLPPPVAPVDPTEVSPKASVHAVRRIGEGTRGSAAQVGGQRVTERGGRAYYRREEVERRLMCRRIYHLPVLLDTRTEERRKDSRRPDDILNHMDREV